MDRRRLLCIEVVLLAAVVACTGSEGPSVEELSTTQLVELAETGPLPTEGTQDVVSPIMAAAKAKVQVLDVQETQEKLAETAVAVRVGASLSSDAHGHACCEKRKGTEKCKRA